MKRFCYNFSPLNFNDMSTKTGIWIDHKKAVIISLEDGNEKLLTIESKAGKRVRLSGGSRSKFPYGTQEFSADNRRDRKYRHNLKRYYAKICNCIKHSDSIYIMGPGEAKIEFKKYLEEFKSLYGLISKIDTAGKMSDAQLAAKIRKHFGEKKKNVIQLYNEG